MIDCQSTSHVSFISLTGITVAGIGLTVTADGPPVLMPERSVEVNIDHTFVPNMQLATNQVWMNGGGAVADFNNNGLPDIFLLSGGHVPDRLYINNGDGTFTDRAESWGLTTIHTGTGAAAGDFNNNGSIDIYVTSFGNLEDGEPTPGRNKLYRNNGDGTFTDVAEQAGVASIHDEHPAGYGPAWGDYTLNGCLDLFVPTFWSAELFSGTLFRNNCDGTFTDVTVEAGVHDPEVWGFQAAFADMNDNGWPDLLVTGDFFTSRYYVNNGDGTFTDMTEESGTGLDSNGMGHAIADINNSGLLDWYVTSIWPYTQSPGNMLYVNQGGHFYTEQGQEAGVHDGAWGWGAMAVDLDHKGWMDLIAVNGRHEWPYWNIPPRLFYNNADGTFTDVAVESGMSLGEQNRGIARLDADRNGLQDILVMNYTHPTRFYRNETPNPGNWLGIDFDTSNNPYLAPNGYGTRVIAEVDDKSYVRYMHGDPSYLSTSELNVHFGLADAGRVDTLTIKWPRGYVTTLTDVPVNQYMTVTAPDLADLNADGTVDVLDLFVLLSHWGPVEHATDLVADLNNDGVIDVQDLFILLSHWNS